MSRSRDSFSEINITPLTDIFLVLLIIMMVIAPLLDQQGLNLVVPDNIEVQQLNEDSKLLTILVSNDNKYFFQDEEVAEKQLGEFLKEKSKNYTDGVLIQSEEDATHGAVVKVMDSARNVGINNITISES